MIAILVDRVLALSNRGCVVQIKKHCGPLRHRVTSGDVAAILEKAVDLLIEKVKKERFAVGRKPRKDSTPKDGLASSRHVPASNGRHVYSRDEGRCAFVDERGKMCAETGMLVRLACWSHNQYLAQQRCGRDFMERARTSRRSATRPGTGRDTLSTTPVPLMEQTSLTFGDRSGQVNIR
jgi:hypothetical protein